MGKPLTLYSILITLFFLSWYAIFLGGLILISLPLYIYIKALLLMIYAGGTLFAFPFLMVIFHRIFSHLLSRKRVIQMLDSEIEKKRTVVIPAVLETRIGKISSKLFIDIFFLINVIIMRFMAFHPPATRKALYRTLGCKIGRNVVLAPGIYLDENFPEMIVIEDDSIIGLRTIVLSHSLENHVMKLGKVRIGRGAFIGARSIVLPGVEIGEYDIIGAGAVVTHRLNPMTVDVGVPAKQIKRIKRSKIQENEETGKNLSRTTG